ncbi:hypothetical protein Zmor_001324 [Zophobas morio]|uniref:Reverse transcriptase domain-containing protein n=1 Tax=Zophobas morio TaxID=2755281 RepID=A0AA38MSJ5_9CUCU|nr:hypothetical protein Zmor_001324 [Zophobas morio]
MSHNYSGSSQLLVDLLLSHHLIQLVDQPTRYRAGQQPSTLDLIITSDDDLLANLEYLDPVGNSDHVVLKVNMQICTFRRERTVSFLRTVTDYKSVNEDLKKLDWFTLLSDQSIEQNWQVFKNVLRSTVSKHSAVITVKRSSTKPWITAKILKLVRTKRALWRKFKRSSSDTDYKIHRDFSNRLLTTIKDARIAYERRIADHNDVKRFYKHVRNQISGSVTTPQLKDENGRVIEDCASVAEIFAQTFSSAFTIAPNNILPSLAGPSHGLYLDSVEFPETVVCAKLKKLKCTKSPGPDEINASLLLNCADSLAQPLSRLMEQSFSQGTLPSDWRIAIVRPIFKKGDKFCSTNYRPVSLTSLVVKIMESIIYESILKFVTEHQLVPMEQHGFLPGKSIISNLLCCLSDWTKELDLGNSVDVIYLDFSKAFDRVPKRHLLFKLQHLGIRGNLYQWIDAFLSERTFRVRVGGALSNCVQVLSGVPQGSVLGPLLFIVYTADLKFRLRSSFAMYADDVKLYNLSNSWMALTQDLLEVCKWSSEWLLPLNIAKCRVLYIGNANPQHTYLIDGVDMCKSDSHVDLGVFVTSTLSWSEHVLSTIRKANKMVYLLGRAFARSHISVISKLYKSYVRPVLEFANYIWSPILQRDIELLESVQRRATRIPFGRIRPQYADRLVMMGLPTLSNRRKRGDLILTFRALKDPQSPIRHLFPLNTLSRTRGHCFKLVKDKFRSTVRQHFISNRVFETWNALPASIVEADTVTNFKIKFDNYNG